MNRATTSVRIALASLALVSPARLVRMSGSSEWPLDRIVANQERWLEANPYDGKAHYTLGRALAFCFVEGRSSAHMGNYELDGERERPPEPIAPAAPVSAQEVLQRLESGVRHLRRACELGTIPESLRDESAVDREMTVARWHLTLAWLLESGAHLADRVPTLELLGAAAVALAPEEQELLARWITELGSEDVAVAESAQASLAAPKNLTRALPLLVEQTASPNARRQRAVSQLLHRAWIECSIAEYATAYDLCIARELASRWPRSSLISYEALIAYERLVRPRGAQGPEEERRLADMAANRPGFEDRPLKSSYITPIVLALDGCKKLDELVAPHFTAPFDLDGDAIDELWPWLAPGTGWLVWDPKERGEITSGTQLFGSASGWLFFEDGYRVLDALDDDRSGELRGHELTGIAVWFDRDSDGVSDRGEVVPVEELGIVALATESTLTFERSPANLCGLELADGRILPTYDWVLAPVAP